MAEPTITVPLIPVGLKAGADGRFRVNLYDPVMLRVVVSDSGNSVGLASLKLSWGDGTEQTTDFKAVRRPVQFDHTYESQGGFTISVTATNSDGSTNFATLSLFVLEAVPRYDAVKPQWNGLATPTNLTKTSLSVGEGSNEVLLTTLAAPMAEGDESLVLSQYASLVMPEMSLLISEPGKYDTYVRVKEVEPSGLIRLWGAALDAYSTAAVVEVKYAGLSRITVDSSSTSNAAASYAGEPWYYPTTTGRDLVRAAWRTNLFTKRGERPMRPEVGSRLHELVFEQNDLVLEADVLDDMRSLAALDPRVVLRDVAVERNNEALIVRTTLSNDGEQATFDVEFGIAT